MDYGLCCKNKSAGFQIVFGFFKTPERKKEWKNKVVETCTISNCAMNVLPSRFGLSKGGTQRCDCGSTSSWSTTTRWTRTSSLPTERDLVLAWANIIQLFLFVYDQIKSSNKIVILIFEIKDRNLQINEKLLSFPPYVLVLAHPMWIALIGERDSILKCSML